MIRIEQNSEYFLVANDFVDNYLCEANGSFVKVYLFLMRHADNCAIELSDIANALNLLESDVVRAFKYWQKMGIMQYSKSGENDYSIEFVTRRQSESDTSKRDLESSDDNSPAAKVSTIKNATAPSAVSYKKSDISSFMKNNDGIRHLFLISEQLLNRSLTDTDCKILFGFYDYLGLPVEVIFTLIEHCISKGKTNMRYIERVAYTWADRDINTLPKASAYVKEENEFALLLKKFKTMFKISGRDFTDTEEAYIRTWVYDMKLNDKAIQAAFETTVTNTGKIAFKYMDAVLKNTVSGSAPVKKTTVTRTEGKKNFFQDYDDEISDLEATMIKKRVDNN